MAVRSCAIRSAARANARKRHLGEGEEGYQPGSEPGVFQLGAARFAIAICAAGGVDFPWTDAAGAGASLVVFCSAPGLHGRRLAEAAWRRGPEWWVGADHGRGLC